MSTQHTPGPWYITGEDDRRYIREEVSDVCVALMIDGGHINPAEAMSEVEITANANIIAAAPDGFDIVEQLEESFTADGTYQQFLPAMRAFLAKAKGEAK